MKKEKRIVRLYDKLHERGSRNCLTGRYHVNFPWLNVSGRWLVEAGFNIGDYVEIRVRNGELIITKECWDGD